jgi:Domain of unknown function (DUF4397)
MRVIYTMLAAVLAALAVALPASAQQGSAMVTVVHGVPGLTVDVYVDGEAALESFEPGTITDPLELPAGEREIAIREAGAPADSDPAIQASATLEAGSDVSVVAHLDADGQPTLTVFENDTSAIAAGEARVVVRHTAAAPEVDVLANGDPLLTGITNPNEASGSVPADTYSVAVAPAGTTDAVLGPTDLALEAGTAYTVYAVGSLEDESLDLLVAKQSGLGAGPGGVPSGDSGLAAGESFPLWAALLIGAGGVLALGSGAVLARGRGR